MMAMAMIQGAVLTAGSGQAGEKGKGEGGRERGGERERDRERERERDQKGRQSKSCYSCTAIYWFLLTSQELHV